MSSWQGSSWAKTARVVLQSLNFLTLTLVLVLVPCVLLWHALNLNERPIRFFPEVFLIASGLSAIGIRLLYIRLLEPHQFNLTREELRFLSLNAGTAWSIGAGAACVILGIYFVFPAHGALFHRFEAGLTFYLTVLGLTLAVHAFYTKVAPITSVEVLLESLIDDLEFNCPDNGRLWVVYPALNIGYYRAHKGDGMSRYKRFQSILRDRASKLKDRAKVIVFKKDLYQALFHAYERMCNQSGIIEQSRIDDCALEATASLEAFEGHRLSPAGESCQKDPVDFPSHVIIIGDVVYLLSSYGLPIFKSDARGFTPVQGETSPILVMAYRRQDPNLARSIEIHLHNAFTATPRHYDEIGRSEI